MKENTIKQLKAIKEFCKECFGKNNVKECNRKKCPLHKFREGKKEE